MGRRILSLLLLTLSAMPASGASDGHPVMMWRVDGQSNTVYLLGSIHMLRAEDHPLPGIIDTAYDDAEVLIMELDMDDLDGVATQQTFNRNGVLQHGTTLRDLMGEALYERVSEAAAAIDIPIEMLDQSEPWLAAITVEMMVLYRVGFNPVHGIELHMTSRAVEDGKPILGLENVEEQLAFLDGLSLEAQRAMLVQTLEESADIGDSIDDLIAAWRHGDVATLERDLLETLASHEELHEVLVTGRNRRWVAEIAELLDDTDDYLVIVGALHLVGSEGVPALLVEEGIRTVQLSEPPAVR